LFSQETRVSSAGESVLTQDKESKLIKPENIQGCYELGTLI